MHKSDDEPASESTRNSTSHPQAEPLGSGRESHVCRAERGVNLTFEDAERARRMLLLQELRGELETWAKRRVWIGGIVLLLVGLFGFNTLVENQITRAVDPEVARMRDSLDVRLRDMENQVRSMMDRLHLASVASTDATMAATGAAGEAARAAGQAATAAQDLTERSAVVRAESDRVVQELQELSGALTSLRGQYEEVEKVARLASETASSAVAQVASLGAAVTAVASGGPAITAMAEDPRSAGELLIQGSGFDEKPGSVDITAAGVKVEYELVNWSPNSIRLSPKGVSPMNADRARVMTKQGVWSQEFRKFKVPERPTGVRRSDERFTGHPPPM